ncbi:hypothetical protein EJ06DRAFT_531053 [Trichodelitschia bisporula]|uniref:Uncharacterized protein n=1 Tax=Trichodelitschia bisporula TaxID=703511 RepID=A0A6G1HUH3_9PEZI|nr:hypothetical protein EJ06DRAFT_531053 [Trichodelitschia bisporula]
MPRSMWLCLLQSRPPLHTRQLTASFLAFCPAVELRSKPQSLAFSLQFHSCIFTSPQFLD